MNVKNSWGQITLSDYQKILALQNSRLDEVEKDAVLLEILSDCGRSEIDALTIPEFRKQFKKLSFLNKEPELKAPANVYTVNGKKFRFVKELKDITAGQLIDLQHYTKDIDQIPHELQNILSIVLLPLNRIRFSEIEGIGDFIKFLFRKRKAMCYEGNKYAPLFLDMPITDVLSISGFFLTISRHFTKVTLEYSIQTARKQMQKVLKDLKKEKNRTKELEEKIKEMEQAISDTNG